MTDTRFRLVARTPSNLYKGYTTYVDIKLNLSDVCVCVYKA